MQLPAIHFPAISKKLEWVNAESQTDKQTAGSPVLLHVWALSCVNCLRTLPYVEGWFERYGDLGLKVIGVHSPEFEFEKQASQVRQAVAKQGIKYPVVIDSELSIWNELGNKYWPRTYLFDASGTLVYEHVGEGAYHDVEEHLRELLHQYDPSIVLPSIQEIAQHDPLVQKEEGLVCYPSTPETYLGYQRGRLSNPEGYHFNVSAKYDLPASRRLNTVSLGGQWKAMPEYVEQTGVPACLFLKYEALEVDVVASLKSNGQLKVVVELDGEPIPQSIAGEDIRWDASGGSYFTVIEPRMYSIIANTHYNAGELKLCSESAGARFYSFSFSGCI